MNIIHVVLASHHSFSPHGDLLYYKYVIDVTATSPWRSRILDEFHSSLSAGHSRYLHTYKQISCNFCWPRVKIDVKQFVVSRDTFEQVNYETIQRHGSLQPLPVPFQTWSDIAISFTEGLSVVHGWNAILVVVDRLSKYGHFIPIKHPYSAAKISILMACLSPLSATVTLFSKSILGISVQDARHQTLS